MPGNEVELRIVWDTKTGEAQIKKFKNDAVGAGDEIENKTDAQSEKIAKAWKTSYKVAGAAAVAFFGASIKASLDFQKAMQPVDAMMSGLAGRQTELANNALAMSDKYALAAGQMAGQTFDLVSGLGQANVTMAKMDIAARTAAAGFDTTGASTSLLISVSKAYNDVSDEMFEKVSDLIFKTNELGQTSVPQLGAAFPQVAAKAAGLNIKIEEVAAGFATFAGVLGNTAEVGTKMRAIMNSFITQSDEMASTILDLGFANAETLLSTEGLSGAIELLIGETDGSVEALGKLFSSSEAVEIAMALAGNQSENFAENLEAMANAAGSGQKAMDELASSDVFRLDQAMNEVANAMIRIGSEAVPGIADAAVAFSALIKDASPLLKMLASFAGETISLVVGGFAMLVKEIDNTAIAATNALGPVGDLINELSDFAEDEAVPQIGAALAHVFGVVPAERIVAFGESVDVVRASMGLLAKDGIGQITAKGTTMEGVLRRLVALQIKGIELRPNEIEFINRTAESQTIFNRILEAETKILNGTATAVELYGNNWFIAARAMGEANDVAEETVATYTVLGVETRTLKNEYEDLWLSFRSLNDAIKESHELLHGSIAITENLTQDVDDFTDSNKDLQEQSNDTFNDMFANFNDADKAFDGMIQNIEDTTLGWEDLEVAIGVANTVMDVFGIESESLFGKLLGWLEDAIRLWDAYSQVVNLATQMTRANTIANQANAQVVTASAGGISSWAGNIASAAGAMATFAAVAATAFIVVTAIGTALGLIKNDRPSVASLGDALSGTPGAFTGGIGGGGAPGSDEEMFSFIAGQQQGKTGGRFALFADGGLIDGPTLALMGEKGDEFVMNPLAVNKFGANALSEMNQGRLPTTIPEKGNGNNTFNFYGDNPESIKTFLNSGGYTDIKRGIVNNDIFGSI